MSFCILGRLAVIHERRDIAPTAPKVRQVLAFLLVRRNQIVPVSEFVDELWGDNPPDSAMTTLQTYIYKLRKDVLDPSGLARLHTQSSGYLLEVEDEIIDVHRFDQLARRGRTAQQRGECEEASELFSEALTLWRGKALLGVTTGEILTAHVTRLEESQLQVLGMRIETDMLLGRHEELISELKGLVGTYPLHERFHAHLMTALERSGRRFEALQVYRRLRELLIGELGLEPSAAVQQLHQEMLSAEPADLPDSPATRELPVVRSASPAAPAQLPPDIPEFTGRAEMLRRIRAALESQRDNDTTARAVLICGMPGVGKTTLALHVAHQVKGRHDHGHLYADLRGSTGEPASTLDVLGGFLRALGVADHEMPVSAEERSSLFRTCVSGRRVLVVLDDADSASQIAPLMPATPRSTVVITSRWGLQGLPGVQVAKLHPMAARESAELLMRLTGRQRVLAEQREAERIAERCGHLPLALRCVGARLAAAPTWSLRKMAALIEAGPSPLDQLRFAEFDVRAQFDRTYFRLDRQDRSALRLLSLLPPPFTTGIASALLGSLPDVVEAQLSRLVAHNLLEAVAGEGRDVIHYQLHPLTHLYARERLNHEFVDPDTTRARLRPGPDREPEAREPGTREPREPRDPRKEAVREHTKRGGHSLPTPALLASKAFSAAPAPNYGMS